MGVMKVSGEDVARTFCDRLLEPGSADAVDVLAVRLHMCEALFSAAATARKFDCTGFAMCSVDPGDEDAPCKDVGLVLHWEGLRYSEMDGFEATKPSPAVEELTASLKERFGDQITEDVSDFRFGGWGVQATELLTDNLEGQIIDARASRETLSAKVLPENIWAIIHAQPRATRLVQGESNRRPRHRS